MLEPGTIDRLDVVGSVRGPSGYDRHTREFVRHLLALGVEVGFTHLDGWSTPMPDELRETWFDHLAPGGDADTVLHFVMPIHLQPRPAARNVNYTMFEAAAIPPDWVHRAELCDLVVVPARAARDAWVAGGVAADRVRIAPLGIDGEFFSQPAPPLPVALPDGRRVSDFSTRFLHMGELRPRKNQVGLLRTWLRATRHDDDAVLILKCPASPMPLESFAADVAAMEREAGRSLREAAPVALAPALLSDEQIRGLYAAATHYISLSHGEGWDLVTMEAAVAGLCLVVPRHTAYVEYLEDEDVEFVPAREAPARFPGRTGIEDSAFFDGLCWWDPDEDAAAEIVRGIVDGTRPRKPPPSARLASAYTWEAAARSLLRALS